MTLFEIYSEALISGVELEQKHLDKIKNLLEDDSNKSDYMAKYRMLINVVTMLTNLSQKNLVEFKKNLDLGKIYFM